MLRSTQYALVVCIAATAAAQNTLVSPTGLTNSYGAINNSIPWGPFVPTGNTIGEIMVQQIDDELLGRTAVLTAMSFRHQFSVAHVAKTFTIQLTLADAATPSAAMSATFASNFFTGGASTVVLNGSLNFPAVGTYPRAPAPFDSPVLFTTPHSHSGAYPLLWEAIIFGTTPVLPTQFYERGPGTTHTAGWVGNGCPISGGVNPLTLNGTTNATTVTNNLTNGPLNAPAALMIGDTSSLFNGAIPLPVNLGFLGSPACDLNINALLFLSTTTTPSGTAAFPIPYTMSPSISGSRLRTQYVAVDGLAIVTSNGLDHSVPYNATTGKRWPQNRAYANGWGTTPPLTGTVQSNGLVTQWTY